MKSIASIERKSKRPADCWVHVRRKFFEIDKAQPGVVTLQVRASIATLYGIGKQIKGQLSQDGAEYVMSKPILYKTSWRKAFEKTD